MSPIMHKISAVILSIAAGCFSMEAQAAVDANSPGTLQGYLRYAALHNAGLKAAFERWKAALEIVPQAKALPDPRFTYGYYIEEVETRVGPQQQRVGISQVFPWFGKIRARTDAAAASAEAARRRYEAKKLELFHEVKDAYYEYAYLAEAIRIAREDLELIRRFEEVARTKYITASAGHPDVIRAQIESALLADKLKTLETRREPIVARLNAALNRPGDSILPWPQRESYDAPDVDRRVVFETLRRQNPRLQALDFDAVAARSRIELAKKRFYPDMTLGVDWIDTDDAIAPGVSDSGKDPVIVMFSMNLPIWRKSYGAAELQARAEARRARYKRKDAENALVARVSGVLYELQDSRRKAELYGDVLIPKGEELLGASETAYSSGTIDFLSLIDAEQRLLKSRLQRQRALATAQQKLAELEMLIGTELGPNDRESYDE